jgi:hypothetical protein
LAGVWDSPIFFPYRNALAFSENLFGLAALVAPVYWTTHDAVLTYNVAFVLSFVIAGAGMYLLAAELTGSRHAAWVAGVFYAFGPYRFAGFSLILPLIATGWIITLRPAPISVDLALDGWCHSWSQPCCRRRRTPTSRTFLVPIACIAGQRAWVSRSKRWPIARRLLIAGAAIALLGPVIYSTPLQPTSGRCATRTV